MDTEAWKDLVLARMKCGPISLRSKGKTARQIVTDAYQATGFVDVELAESLLKQDERFAVGDKPSRWVPAESAHLVAETLAKKQNKKARPKFAPKRAPHSSGIVGTRDAFARSAPGTAQRSRDFGPRRGAASTLSSRIEVEDTTQTVQRYIDQVCDDDREEDAESDRSESEAEILDHREKDLAIGIAPSAVSMAHKAWDGPGSEAGANATIATAREALLDEEAYAIMAPSESSVARAAVLESYFFSAPVASSSGGSSSISRCALVDRAGTALLKECSLLGMLTDPTTPSRAVFLNTQQPFCLVTVGVQGGGKSHTLACVIEAVLLDGPENSIVKLAAPHNAVVLHYDQNVSSCARRQGLFTPIRRCLERCGVKAEGYLHPFHESEWWFSSPRATISSERHFMVIIVMFDPSFFDGEHPASWRLSICFFLSPRPCSY